MVLFVKKFLWCALCSVRTIARNSVVGTLSSYGSSHRLNREEDLQS
jgi:hypothetical protein